MTMTYLVLGLGVAWVLQFVLSFFQMRRFYRRISELRRQHGGAVAIGMAGSAWRRRQYAVLVVDQNKHILAAEQLSGWTIFAALKPLAGLVGLHAGVLLDENPTLPVPLSKKLVLALRSAAEQIYRAEATRTGDADGDPEQIALLAAGAE